MSVITSRKPQSIAQTNLIQQIIDVSNIRDLAWRPGDLESYRKMYEDIRADFVSQGLALSG